MHLSDSCQLTCVQKCDQIGAFPYIWDSHLTQDVEAMRKLIPMLLLAQSATTAPIRFVVVLWGSSEEVREACLWSGLLQLLPLWLQPAASQPSKQPE